MSRCRLPLISLALLAFPTGCLTDGGAEAPPASRIEVVATWSVGRPDSEQVNFMRVLDGFTDTHEVIVDYTFVPGSRLAEVLRDRIDRNDSPDVVLLPQPGLLAELACEGHVSELIGEVEQAVRNNYEDRRSTYGTYDGRLYGVWFKAANKSLIWYDVAEFERHGIASGPRTWEALLDVAEHIADKHVTPFSVAGHPADTWTLTDWFENVFIRVAGAEKYDRLGERGPNRLPWTDGSVEKAVAILRQLLAQPDLVIHDAGNTTYPQSIAKVFKDLVATAVFEGDFVAAEIRAIGAKLGDAGFFRFPSIDGSREYVVAAGDIAVRLSDSPNPSDADDLMKFLATPEAAAKPWADEGGFISPTRWGEDYDYGDDKMSAGLAEMWEEADAVRFDLSDRLPPDLGSNPRAGLYPELRRALLGRSNPREFGNRMEAFVDRMEAFADRNDDSCPTW